MRALLIGAVEGTRVAMHAIAAATGWELAGLLTLPAAHAARHSDYADLAGDASAFGASLIFGETGNEPQTIAAIRALKPDISFVVGWSKLCGQALIEAAGGRMVAYHPAPLPRLRGRAAIPWTILLDEPVSASTLFWARGGVDEGPILAQSFFLVSPEETAASLYAKHMHALRQALGALLPELLMGDPPGMPQDPCLATYGARRRPTDGEIDWHASADVIHRLVRAVGRPYPGAFTSLKNARVRVWQTRVEPERSRHHAIPGQIVAVDSTAFAVSCGDGKLIWVTDHVCEAGPTPGLHAILGARAT